MPTIKQLLFELQEHAFNHTSKLDGVEKNFAGDSSVNARDTAYVSCLIAAPIGPS